MFFFTLIPYKLWQKYATFILFISFGLLIIVLIPGIGIVRGGAQSWIGVGAFSIQPSEFVKLSLIIFIAERLTVYGKKITSFLDRKSTRLNSSHVATSYAVFCLKKKIKHTK